MPAKVEVYVTNYCPYCTYAKKLLTKKNVNYEVIDVTDDPTRRRWLVKASGRQTVPQIFINGTPVGGFDDINLLDKQGKLDPMLAQPAD